MDGGFMGPRIPQGWEAGLEVEYFPAGTRKIRGWGKIGTITEVEPPTPYRSTWYLTVEFESGTTMVVEDIRVICLDDYIQEPRTHFINNAPLILASIFNYKYPHDFEPVRTGDTVIFSHESHFEYYSAHIPYKVTNANHLKKYIIIETLLGFVELHYEAGIEVNDLNP